MYYVISGGLSVYLDRSRDLSKWEPSKQHGVVLQTTVNDTRVCTEYIGYKPRASEQALLASAEAAFPKSCSWDWWVYGTFCCTGPTYKIILRLSATVECSDASDVDVWEMGDGTTLFFFLSGNQGSHIFAALGQFKGTMRAWFEGQYEDAEGASALATTMLKHDDGDGGHSSLRPLGTKPDTAPTPPMGWRSWNA
jgi:hypothetical protein